MLVTGLLWTDDDPGSVADRFKHAWRRLALMDSREQYLLNLRRPALRAQNIPGMISLQRVSRSGIRSDHLT